MQNSGFDLQCHIDYDRAANTERNERLKVILKKIDDNKKTEDEIVIDMYSIVQIVNGLVGIINTHMFWSTTPPGDMESILKICWMQQTDGGPHMDFYKVPIGFGMALAMNPNALNAYSAMTDEQKQAIVNKARSAGSEQEMHEIVNSIVK